jgi:hypothetical protein
MPRKKDSTAPTMRTYAGHKMVAERFKDFAGNIDKVEKVNATADVMMTGVLGFTPASRKAALVSAAKAHEIANFGNIDGSELIAACRSVFARKEARRLEFLRAFAELCEKHIPAEAIVTQSRKSAERALSADVDTLSTLSV